MKKSLLFGMLAAFATTTEKKVENKTDKVNQAVKTATPDNKIEKQSAKDVKPAQSSTVSDCCKPNNNCDNTCKNKKKLSTTNASDQPNAAVKPKPQTKPESGSTNNANDR